MCGHLLPAGWCCLGCFGTFRNWSPCWRERIAGGRLADLRAWPHLRSALCFLITNTKWLDSLLILLLPCWTVSLKLWAHNSNGESNQPGLCLKHRYSYSVRLHGHSWHVVRMNWIATVWSSINSDIDSLVGKVGVTYCCSHSPSYFVMLGCSSQHAHHICSPQTAEVNFDVEPQRPNWNSLYWRGYAFQ